MLKQLEQLPFTSLFCSITVWQEWKLREKWQPYPVSLGWENPWREWAQAYSPWGLQGSDTTKRLSLTQEWKSRKECLEYLDKFHKDYGTLRMKCSPKEFLPSLKTPLCRDKVTLPSLKGHMTALLQFPNTYCEFPWPHQLHSSPLLIEEDNCYFSPNRVTWFEVQCAQWPQKAILLSFILQEAAFHKPHTAQKLEAINQDT